VRAAVLAPHLGLAGGGERVALEVARVLADLGYAVEVHTYDILELRAAPIDVVVSMISSYRPRVVVHRPPALYRVLRASGRFKRLSIATLVGGLLRAVKGKYDLVFDVGTNMPSRADAVYIHYPYPYQRSGGRGLYELAVSAAFRSVAGEPGLVLANSSWTARLFSTMWGYGAEVLHPPVDVEYFSNCSGDRDPGAVVTVSRYTPEKNLAGVLRVAELLRGLRFTIVGTLAEYGREVYEGLRAYAEEKGLDNVKLLANVSRERLREILCGSTLYLHPPYPEHFGISVVEAMAAGLVPIVYRGGGAWEDVASRIHSSLGYTSPRQAADVIISLRSAPELASKLAARASKLAWDYSSERFASKLKSLLTLMGFDHAQEDKG